MMELQDYPSQPDRGSKEMEVGGYDSGYNNQGYQNDQGNPSPPQPGYYGSGYPPSSAQSPPPATGYPTAGYPQSPPPGSAGYASSTGYSPSVPGSYYPSGGYGGTKPVTAPKVIVQSAQSSQPEDYLILAIVCAVVNPLMGALALYFSFESRKAWNMGDYHTAAKRSRDTLWISIGGIVFTLVMVFTSLIIYYTQGLVGHLEELQTFSNVDNVDFGSDDNAP